MTPEEGITFNTHRVEVNFTLVALPKERGESKEGHILIGNVTPVNNLLIPVSVVFQPMDWDGAKFTSLPSTFNSLSVRIV